jgi:hypothetical protein
LPSVLLFNRSSFNNKASDVAVLIGLIHPVWSDTKNAQTSLTYVSVTGRRMN